MKEILELMQANGVKKIELIHLVDMTPAMGESDEDVMVVNTIEQDKQGTLVCYDNRDEDEQGKYQPLWNVAQLPKQVQDELLFSVKYTLQQKSESVVGRKVAFQYNGKRYEREVVEVCDIILGTWVGNLGFEQEDNDHSDSFLIHGNTTDKRVPLMQGLVVQYDSEDGSRHGYVREVEVL